MYFHVPAGGAPLFRPERPADGRWQRGEVVEGFYLAADDETTWAEWYRALAELAVPPMRQFEVELESVIDLYNVGKLEAVGLPQPVPSPWLFRLKEDSLESGAGFFVAIRRGAPDTT